MTYYDLCLRSEEAMEKAEELGWETGIKTVFLEADDWGELKRKVGKNREEADVIVFRGGDEDLNRKAAEESRIDVLLHPEKGRKDSGVNQVIAKAAAENNVTIGFDLKMLNASEKARSHILHHWSRNLMLCEKYDASYIITSGAEDRFELRAPRELQAIIDSLGYSGKKAVSDHPSEIVEKARERREDGFVRPGETVRGDPE